MIHWDAVIYVNPFSYLVVTRNSDKLGYFGRDKTFPRIRSATNLHIWKLIKKGKY